MLVLVKQFIVLDAAYLRTALVGVFEGGVSIGLPDRPSPPPTGLGGTVPVASQEIGVDPDLRAGYADAAAPARSRTSRPRG